MTKEALQKLRSKLPRHYRKELASRTGKSESAVYQALRGDIDSPSIIDAAIDWAQELAPENKSKVNRINSL